MKKLLAQLAIFALLVSSTGLMFVNSADAAVLTYRALLMSRNEENVASGMVYTLFFTPATSLSGGADSNSVILRFPDADDGEWCRTAGALVTATATEDYSGSAAIAIPSTSGLTATCTQGTGAADYDYIEIEDVDDLTSGTKYGVEISDTGVGALGTGSTEGDNLPYLVCTDDAEAMDDQCTGATDTGGGRFSTASTSGDTVSVTADVDVATFAFDISTDTCALGTIIYGSQMGACGIALTTTTSSTSGYVTTVYDESTGLDDGSNDIDDVAADTAINNATEAYGISSEDGGAGGADIADYTSGGGEVGAECAAAIVGPLGTFDPMGTTALSVVETATTASAEEFEVCIAAAAGATTADSNYTDEVTFTSTGYF